MIVIIAVIAFLLLAAFVISGATVTTGVSSTLLKAADFGDGHNAQDPVNFTTKTRYTTGTGANKANQHWHDDRSLSSGANDDLDLAGGLTDIFGTTVTFTIVKAIYIKNKSTTDALRVGGGGANEWVGATTPFLATGDKLVIPPSGELLLQCPTAAGWPVTAGSADVLRLTHPGTTSAALTYDIFILGEA